ncbi:mRNA 3' end processing factor, partial [Tieghemiomyces parasiticus]
MQASKATLDAVHRSYTRALAPLTINSRPLIKDLTLLAEKNIHAAPAVVHAICSRLKSGHRKECLPALYLIDSICKNVGRDYLRYFSESIPGAFVIAYRRINPNDQHQFRRVLEIWKSSPGGPIFHPRAIATIDKELGLGKGSAAPTQHRAPPAQRPEHGHNHAHYGPQHQPPLPPPSAQPHHYHQPQATPPLSTTQTAFTGANTNPLALLNALTSGLTASMAPAQPAVGTGLDSASLLQSLLASNLLGNMPLLTSLAPPAAAGVPPALAATMSATPFMPALSTGPTSPFPTITPLAPPPSTVIEFTNEDLQQKRTGLAEPLYGALALHCHQCGARYPDTPKGRKQLSNHLDWHFRRNRRLKEKLRQAQPRGWLVSEEDWIESRQSSNEEVTSAAIFDQVGNGGTTNGNGLAHGDGADGDDNNNHGGEVGLGEGVGGGGSDNDDDSEENGE